jgi:hypothetical protein
MEEDPIVTPGVEEIATPSVTTATPGETPVTTSETPAEPKEQYVPLSRFKEVNDRAKAAEERAAAVEARQEQITRAFAPETVVSDDLDPDVAQTLSKAGFMTKADFLAEQAKVQIEQDSISIKSELGLTDEEMTAARKHAKDMGVVNAEGLRAATRDLYFDKIMENKAKEVASGTKPKATAEKPGPGGAVISGDDTKKPMTIRERIVAAREKQNQT